MSTEDGECIGRPKRLTFDQKQRRVDDSEQCVMMIKCNNPEFLHRYVTIEETWPHYLIPKSNRQSSEWTAHYEPASKRGKTQLSAAKFIASVFWDAHGINFIDYLEKGRTINSDYYRALLDRLKDEIAQKWPHLKKKEVSGNGQIRPPTTVLRSEKNDHWEEIFV
ncbi:hypothetical protein GWI33_005901 [Rhynchophorus ferrugineus]|uniref:Transposase n=1 Tax=Rhynchophorus ferrugineus TaxID=354439 RepID=A0A834MLY2_RHYFE|nr:hypothetical protein GWI33_005901 [Rhynchophorus ferrugineus]